jgi:hypothetical protein
VREVKDSMRRFAWFLAAVLAVSSVTACDMFLGSTKVGQGQLYAMGDEQYDEYFRAVHEEQVAGTSWPDEKKESRKDLASALSVTPTASEGTLLDATRERAKKGEEGGLRDAVSGTSRAELERARKMREANDRIAKLLEVGEVLKREADEARTNMGANKADEEKVKRARELSRELSASLDVLRALSRDATKEARRAEELAEDLGDALEGKERRARDRSRETTAAAPAAEKAAEADKGEEPETAPAPAAPAKKPARKAGEKKATAAPKPAAKPKPAEPVRAAEKPKPAEPPPPKAADEVFNP